MIRDDSFDLTRAVTVLESVADPAAAVAEPARVTRGGGALNLHNPWGLTNRRRLRTACGATPVSSIPATSDRSAQLTAG